MEYDTIVGLLGCCLWGAGVNWLRGCIVHRPMEPEPDNAGGGSIMEKLLFARVKMK